MEAIKARLDSSVAAGKITQAQAKQKLAELNKYRSQRAAAKKACYASVPGKPKDFKRFPKKKDFAKLPTTTKLKLLEYRLAYRTCLINTLATAGVLTKEKAKKRLDRMTARLRKRIVLLKAAKGKDKMVAFVKVGPTRNFQAMERVILLGDGGVLFQPRTRRRIVGDTVCRVSPL